MSSEKTSSSSITPPDSEEDKRRKHAEAQRRYREKNLAATHEKARVRMRTLRDKIAASRRLTRLAAAQRHVRDAEDREVKRKRKFVAKFGHRAFFDYYLPQHDILGVEHLPGLTAKYAREHGLDATSTQFSPLLSSTVPSMAVCEIPFYPNGNYISDVEHDVNPRKLWFLILDWGLYTKKSDAAVVVGAKILIFDLRGDAERRWAENCRKWHTHTPGESSSDVSTLGAPLARSTARSTASAPAPTSVTTTPSCTKAKQAAPVHTQVKEERRPKPLPLFVDDDDDDVAPVCRRSHASKKRAKPETALPHALASSASATTPASFARTSSTAPGALAPVSAMPASSTRPQRSQGGAPFAKKAPQTSATPPQSSCAQASSVRGYASPPAPALHTFNDQHTRGRFSPGASASVSRGLSPAAHGPTSASASRRPLPPASPPAPAPHASNGQYARGRFSPGTSASVSRGLSPDARGDDPRRQRGTTHVFYKDPVAAVREMGDEEKVELVEHQEVTEFLSTRARRE
ncbi:hypothetical protein B0H11DRAFT_1918250 [Mycena galericulata]|nr:hypothetical protein B0H11DRAFT_1918250 [Mycena galericulata]